MQDDDLRLLGIPRSRCIYKHLSQSCYLLQITYTFKALDQKKLFLLLVNNIVVRVPPRASKGHYSKFPIKEKSLFLLSLRALRSSVTHNLPLLSTQFLGGFDYILGRFPVRIIV